MSALGAITERTGKQPRCSLTFTKVKGQGLLFDADWPSS